MHGSPHRRRPWRTDQDKTYALEQRLNAIMNGLDPWNTPVLAGFGNIAGDQVVKYRFTASGLVEITGAMTASGNYTGGSTIWTMGATYRPGSIAQVAVVIDTSGTFTAGVANVHATGVVEIPLNVANTAFVLFSGGSYRLAA